MMKEEVLHSRNETRYAINFVKCSTGRLTWSGVLLRYSLLAEGHWNCRGGGGKRAKREGSREGKE